MAGGHLERMCVACVARCRSHDSCTPAGPVPTVIGLARWCGVLVSGLSLAAAGPRPATGVERVVIVSVDGLRPDLLQRGRTPAMEDLRQHGSYTMAARTVVEGYTVPSHVSMLTGVVPSRHGVTWNRHIEQAYPQVPTVFELARRAGYTTALAVGKTKLIVLTRPDTLDRLYIGNEDQTDALDLARAAREFIKGVPAPGVLFVHFGDVDDAGHANGWGSPEQLDALEKVDRAFALVRQTLRERHLIEHTVIILTADHGGAGTEHPPEELSSQLVPWIVSGPSVRQGFDLASVKTLSIDTMTTFATVCVLLGIDVPHAIDGKAVLDILNPVPRPVR